MIVSYEFYSEDYKGQEIAEAEFDRLNLRAEDDIDNMANKPLGEISDWEELYVKKAICSQIEYYFLNGDTFNFDTAQSEGIGKFNYSLGRAKSEKRVLSPRATSYLGKTSLVFRGVC